MHPRISLHQIVFDAGSSLASNLADCRQIGFSSVGLIDQRLLAHQPAEVARLVSAHDLRVASMTCTPLFAPGDPDRWSEAERKLLTAIDLATAVRSPLVYGCTGSAGNLTWSEAAAVVAQRCPPVLQRSRTVDVSVLVEPTLPTYADISFVSSLRDCLDISRETGLGINLDIWHVWAERDLEHAIRAASPFITHCQIADFRIGNRTMLEKIVPGDGGIPLKQILGWLLEAGYEGVFEIEIHGPTVSEEGRIDAAQRAGDVVGTLLDELGA